MKVAQRQPICITRLKKKQSGHNLPPTETSMCRQSRQQLYQVGQNTSIDSLNPKQNHYKLSSRQFFTSSEAHSYLQKQNTYQLNQNCNVVSRDEQLLKRIKELEASNEDLNYRNRELFVQLGGQQSEKLRLNARIEKLERQFVRLESQLEQQSKIPLTKIQVNKINPIDIRFTTPKARQQHAQRSSQLGYYRRLSFHENTQYKSQDLSTKVKQYKNQLEIQKIRRLNLQRQLQNCKQNLKLEFKNQIQALQHKLENYKEAMTRKDKEIMEKQDLIQRYIVKK